MQTVRQTANFKNQFFEKQTAILKRYSIYTTRMFAVAYSMHSSSDFTLVEYLASDEN